MTKVDRERSKQMLNDLDFEIVSLLEHVEREVASQRVRHALWMGV